MSSVRRNTPLQLCREYALAVTSSRCITRALDDIKWRLTSMAINETFDFVKGYFRRNYVTELEVSSSDKCYRWLLQWIALHNDQLLQFTVNTKFKNNKSGHFACNFDYEPCSGEHVFKYKGSSITVKRYCLPMNTNELCRTPIETLNLSIWGRKRHLLDEIMEEARLHAIATMESGTTLMVPMMDMWSNLGEPRVRRSVSSVILDEGVFENIRKDIQNFINDHSWYLDRGIPYRRGYLLYGPPGCGKTSLIMALAGEINYSVCVLNLNDSNMSDDALIQLMGAVPSKSLVLLEDIDAMFLSRDGETVIDGSNNVTLSGLLNSLDGVISSEGRILFMTTNYMDKLDPALIRCGRIDMKQYIGPCSDYQLSQMFKRFRPDGTDEDNKQFVNKLRKRKVQVIPANLQEFFLTHRHNSLKVLFKNINTIGTHEKTIQLTEKQ